MRNIFFLILSLSYTWTMGQQQRPLTSSELLLQLKKLNVLGSVLYVGAHPDDENNPLLPWLANEKLYRTAYLSLTRGDGGQNLIGDEQGVELGMIRTQELLAARKVDGAEQYFTRAYEFGFSKSADEALRIWDREKILADVVWVIRRYQPDVIIKRFPPDARAGHGHHAASAVLADEAFTAAADPKRFPEQFKYGVKPWQAKRIMWNTFNFGGNNTTGDDQLKVDIGGYNALLGKSYGELGGEARTMHKSQGEGRPRNRGQSFQYFVTTAGDPAQNDLMEGVVTDWGRIAGGEKIQSMISGVIGNFKTEQPELSVPALVAVYHAIKALPTDAWSSQKLSEVQALIAGCGGLYMEVITSQQKVVQGDTLRVNLVSNQRRNIGAVLKKIKLEQMDSTLAAPLPVNQNLAIAKTISVADDKKISQPYWLEYPLAGGTFEVRDQMMIGKAENDPPFMAVFTVGIAGEDINFERPVQYRFVDPVKGDLYQPVAVLPKIEISYAKENYLSVNNHAVTPVINVRSNGREEVSAYSVQQKFSSKWKLQSSTLTPSTTEQNITEEISAVAKKGATVYDSYIKTISYDHIPTITWFPRAKTNLVKLDIKTRGKKIGYVIGAGDRVPQALEAMGYEVKYLTEEDINDENLRQFDAVITGVRAFNIYEYLTNKNDVLNRYIENGGNLIVQYLKFNNVGAKRVKVGPYPFAIDAGLRVTEEDAAVKFLLPTHPVLNTPNIITAKDFEGWVQERSTYQLSQRDEHYVLPLGMHDKDDAESNGSLVIAPYGKGNFIYASLVFFRQLPAGVPGAYRLMANLIALKNDAK